MNKPNSLNKHLVIASDLGLLRAYRVVRGAARRLPHLELVEELAPQSAHLKLSARVSDKAGRFPQGRGANPAAGNLSAGEPNKSELEQTRRLVRLFAARINTLLRDDVVEDCWLAASPPIRHRLLNQLKAPARAKIRKTFALDLARAHPVKVLRATLLEGDTAAARALVRG